MIAGLGEGDRTDPDTPLGTAVRLARLAREAPSEAEATEAVAHALEALLK